MHTTIASRNVWHFKQIISCHFILKSRDKSGSMEHGAVKESVTTFCLLTPAPFCALSPKQITAGLDLARAWLVIVPQTLFVVCGQTQQGTHNLETPMQNAPVAAVPEPLLLASLQVQALLLHFLLPSCWCKDPGQVRELNSNLSCYLRLLSCSKSDISCYYMYHYLQFWHRWVDKEEQDCPTIYTSILPQRKTLTVQKCWNLKFYLWFISEITTSCNLCDLHVSGCLDLPCTYP